MLTKGIDHFVGCVIRDLAGTLAAADCRAELDLGKC